MGYLPIIVQTMKKFIIFSLLITSFNILADLKQNLDKDLDSLMEKVIEWRHDIHEHPELGNREFKTSKKICFLFLYLLVFWFSRFTLVLRLRILRHMLVSVWNTH